MRIPSYTLEALTEFLNSRNSELESSSINHDEVSCLILISLKFKKEIDAYNSLKTIASLQGLCFEHELVSFIDFMDGYFDIKAEYTVSPEEAMSIAKYEKELEERAFSEYISNLNDPFLNIQD